MRGRLEQNKHPHYRHFSNDIYELDGSSKKLSPQDSTKK